LARLAASGTRRPVPQVDTSPKARVESAVCLPAAVDDKGPSGWLRDSRRARTVTAVARSVGLVKASRPARRGVGASRVPVPRRSFPFGIVSYRHGSATGPSTESSMAQVIGLGGRSATSASQIPNEKRKNEKGFVSREAATRILGWTKSGHRRCDWGSSRVAASDTGAVSRLSRRSSAACRCGGGGCAWRRGCAATPVACADGGSATRRRSRPMGVWRPAVEHGVSGVVMAAASTTVGARR